MGNSWPLRQRESYSLISRTSSASSEPVGEAQFVSLQSNVIRRHPTVESSGSCDTGYFSKASSTKSSRTDSRERIPKRQFHKPTGIEGIFEGAESMAAISEKSYPCVLLNREVCFDFDKNTRLYSLSNEESQEVTNISNCLKKGFSILMVGQGSTEYTETEILQIRGEKCILCLVLDYDEMDQCFTQMSEDLLQLSAKGPSFWTSKAGKEQDKFRHFTTIDVHTYSLLRKSGLEFYNEEFEEYLKNMKISSNVIATFGERKKMVKTYPAREEIRISNDVVNVVVPMDNFVDDEVDDCLNQCRHQNISVQWAVNDEEETNICNYMFTNDAPCLSEDSKTQMHSVIDKYTESLMRAHSNLIAIKGSAFRSKQEGTHITPEECIVLYCTGKGIIPLLEMQFPKELDNFQVDVREDCLSFGGRMDYEKILSMGLSIGLDGRPSSGSLGPFVEEKDQLNNVHCGFLTCSHVCFGLKELQQKPHTKVVFSSQAYRILQPSSEHNNQSLPIDTIFCGTVRSSYYGDVNCDRNKVIGVDIAHVRIEKKARIPNKAEFAESKSNDNILLPQTGDIVRNITETIPSKLAYKCGVGTGYSRGKIDMDGETNINTENMHGDCGDRIFTLYHQYKVFSNQKIFDAGDSGAAVYVECNGDIRLLGILVGGSRSGKQYYVSPITAVLQALGDNITIKNFSNPEPMDL